MRRNNVAARTEFTVADMAEFWAAIEDLQQRVATLERLVETLVARSLTASQNDADLLRADIRIENRLAKLEYMPRPQMQGYSRSGPALDWQDGTQSHPQKETPDVT